MKPKLIVILGQTATGKSDLAVEIARKYNGEVISADSRQVYKGLDIGSGKITKKEMKGIKHHMLDIISPNSKTLYSVGKFQKDVNKIIEDILNRNKVPILAGGTAFYIQSIVDGISIPEVKENEVLRQKLGKLSLEKLFAKLEKLDPERASQIDSKNKVRLIRALEIVDAIGKVPKQKTNQQYDVLQIGLKWPKEVLQKRIYQRILSRLKPKLKSKHDMIDEVHNLHFKNKVSWKRLESFGLEYRYISQYLKKELSKEEMIEKLNTEIWHFAKRQNTWFKKDERIKWFDLSESYKRKVDGEVRGFLK